MALVHVHVASAAPWKENRELQAQVEATIPAESVGEVKVITTAEPLSVN
jgi:hypothetical protein